MKFMKANRIAPDGMPCFAASHLGLFCLPMSLKRMSGLYGTQIDGQKEIGFNLRPHFGIKQNDYMEGPGSATIK